MPTLATIAASDIAPFVLGFTLLVVLFWTAPKDEEKDFSPWHSVAALAVVGCLLVTLVTDTGVMRLVSL